MNIAILNCLNATSVCTGSTCFKAYNNRTNFFADYPEKPTLHAFFHCGGCDTNWRKDRITSEKLERLRMEGVKRIHIGKCIGAMCEHRDEIIALLERHGLEVVFGTH